jgi:beta-carotene hydroxylase
MGEVTAINDLAPEDIDLATIDLDTLTDSELGVLERKVASRYLNIVPWGAIVWAFTNLAVWLALWPLVFADLLPLWLAFPIATLNCALAYLPSHEAQHSIIGARGRPLRWLNELVGHLSTIPLVQPYRVLKHTHMQHHAHANDEQLDPDYGVHAKDSLDFLKRSVLGRQPEGKHGNAYFETMQRVGKAHMIGDAIAFNAVYLTVLFVCAWTGHAIEAALLWWLPRHLALTYIQYYLSWAPHHPGHEQGRYRDTRGFKSKAGNLASMGMQYHIIHHLYPRIPLMKTGDAYFALKPILQKRGCDLGTL